jgi:hypothetical protein
MVKPSQVSLYEQLLQVRALANQNGYYDAADFITLEIEHIEENENICDYYEGERIKQK